MFVTLLISTLDVCMFHNEQSQLTQDCITHVVFGHFLYSVQDYATLCLDCCMALATALLALDILWKHSFSQSTLATMRYTNLCFTYLHTYTHWIHLPSRLCFR